MIPPPAVEHELVAPPACPVRVLVEHLFDPGLDADGSLPWGSHRSDAVVSVESAEVTVQRRPVGQVQNYFTPMVRVPVWRVVFEWLDAHAFLWFGWRPAFDPDRLCRQLVVERTVVDAVQLPDLEYE